MVLDDRPAIRLVLPVGALPALLEVTLQQPLQCLAVQMAYFM